MMINSTQIKAYLRLKQDITHFIADPTNGFQSSRRHVSEGLAHSLTMHAEEWVYSTQPGGYSFSNHRHRFSVFISEAPSPPGYFTTQELVNYLRAYTALEDLNQMVVDTWLTHAAMRGDVVQVNKGWELVETSAR
jgi:hypothetical protein